MGIQKFANEINVGFSPAKAYDFIIKTERREHEENGKKIVCKRKYAYYGDCFEKEYVSRMTSDKAPKCLRNVEYIGAPSPFVKEIGNRWGSCCTWSISTALLGFKMGYCDSFISSENGIFSAGISTKAIIIIDPIQRIKVREWTEKEFANWFRVLEESKFAYAISYFGNNSQDFLGTSLDKRFDTWEKCLIDAEKFVSEQETEDNKDGSIKDNSDGWYNVNHKERVEGIARMNYYSMVSNTFGRKISEPILFENKEEATKFALTLKNEAYGDFRNRHFDIVLTNIEFNDYLRNLAA